MNLLTETLDDMKEIGKTPDDVVYVKLTKNSGFWREFDESYPDEIFIDFDTFKELANREYDNGYGSNNVNQSTAILFNDNTVMHRWEYDGAEGWEYIKLSKTSPKKYDKKLVSEFLWGKGSYRMDGE